MMKWRRSSPSTCSPEQALAQDLLLSLHLEVVPVPPPPTENLLLPAGLVVHTSPPALHRVREEHKQDNKVNLNRFF